MAVPHSARGKLLLARLRIDRWLEVTSTTRSMPASGEHYNRRSSLRAGEADEGSESAVKGAVVLVAYHFPPDAAVGSLRAAKVARAFLNEGYSVDVVTSRLPGETGMRTTTLPALRV